MEIFSELRSFIVKSKLKGRKDTGGIFDDNMRVLAYFRHEHTWRTPRGPFKIAKQARATDIYLESIDGTLFGEINEVPPKLFSMRLIRTFEIYDDKKELVGVVREKPKRVGSDWVLENLEKTVIALTFGDRENKYYEVRNLSGQVLVRCFRDSSLDEDSYRVDVLGGGVDLFLVLCYVVVLDLAKTLWTTRSGWMATGIGYAKEDKEHLVKTHVAQNQVKNNRSAKNKGVESVSECAKRNLVLSVLLTVILFSLGNTLSQVGSRSNVFFYGFGVAVIVTAILGVTRVKMKEDNETTVFMGIYGMICLIITHPFLYENSELTQDGVVFTLLMFIVGLGIFVNVLLSAGILDFG